MLKKPLSVVIALGFVLCAQVGSDTRALQSSPNSIAVDNDDLAGTVTGASGPEAGVWVIAETTDLSTPFVKIVVTDDRGRYLIPDLPKANYRVWVRGYGLVDSPKVAGTPGATLNLRAVPAASPAAAAQYYPAANWLSLMEMPGKHEFPGTGDSGNGISPNIKSQGDWIQRSEVRRLHRMPCAWHEGHQRNSGGARPLLDDRRSLGSPREVGSGRQPDERWPEPVRPRPRAEDVRGLDRSSTWR